jgi:8-hydroxy-5-deazaflavin:NADPH oxidoreductase
VKIGIIGAGQIGGTLTRRLTALGHDVAVANSRGPESLADLAAKTGAKPVSVKDAAKFGEIVVVTIPEKNIPDLPRDLFAETPKSAVVIDTGNYYPRQRDGRIDGIEAGADREPVGCAEVELAGGQGLQQYLRRTPSQSGQAQRHAGPDRVACSR